MFFWRTAASVEALTSTFPAPVVANMGENIYGVFGIVCAKFNIEFPAICALLTPIRPNTIS